MTDKLECYSNVSNLRNVASLEDTALIHSEDKTVPHQRLLHEMGAYGIQLKWLEDFLIGRSQQVAVNGTASSKVPVTSGVPQGSVLGPVIFLIYMNDLPEFMNSFIKIFADNTKIFRRIEKADDCKALQSDINKLEEWANLWQMKFHPEKCEDIRIGKNHPPFQYQIITPVFLRMLGLLRTWESTLMTNYLLISIVTQSLVKPTISSQ